MATNQNSRVGSAAEQSNSDLHLSSDQLESIFETYGITNSRRLIKGTHRELTDRGITEFNPTPQFADALQRAFDNAFIKRADAPIIPEAVNVATGHATNWTIHNFLDAEYCALREAVLPKFYKRVVYYFSVAAANGADIQAAIYFDDSDDDGRGPLIDA